MHLFRTKSVKSRILVMFNANDSQINNSSEAKTSSIRIVVESSPFYYESGGQECDSGFLTHNGREYPVNSITTQKEILFHRIEHDSKEIIKVGAEIELKVDDVKRTGCIRNHSTSHIINSVIKQLKKLPI